jgi:hypothetical protein
MAIIFQEGHMFLADSLTVRIMRISLFSVLIPVFAIIAGCSKGPPASATDTRIEVQASVTPTSKGITPTLSYPLSPTPMPTAISLPYPYPVIVPSKPPRPTSTPTSTPTQVVKPSTPLQQTSIESILEWINYGVVFADITVFEKLVSSNVNSGNVNYGPFQSEGTGTYTKDQFLDEIRRRITSQPRIVTYEYFPGEITGLLISTRDWFPAWEFMGFGDMLSSNCVVFDFSDQWTKEEGLYLFGVYTTSCMEHSFSGTPFP